MLVLVIGDLCIPNKCLDLPLKFKKLLVPGKISKIIATGSLSYSLKSYLETVCPSIVTPNSHHHHHHGQVAAATLITCLVRGEKAALVDIEGWKIGSVQSDTALLDTSDEFMKEAIARGLDCDLLITNGSHVFGAYERNKRFFLDPGSATGAWTIDLDEQPVPSFVLMDVNKKQITCYIYKLVDGQVKVEKLDFKKPLGQDQE